MAEFTKHITGEHFSGKRTEYSNFPTKCAAEHVLDDKSTAQARVQMQIVSQLELQLQKVEINFLIAGPVRCVEGDKCYLLY